MEVVFRDIATGTRPVGNPSLLEWYLEVRQDIPEDCFSPHRKVSKKII